MNQGSSTSRLQPAGSACQIRGDIRLKMKCTINVICLNHPPYPGQWKNCLPRNWSLEPKSLGTAALCYLTQCWNAWRHLLKILELFIWGATKNFLLLPLLTIETWSTEFGLLSGDTELLTLLKAHQASIHCTSKFSLVKMIISGYTSLSFLKITSENHLAKTGSKRAGKTVCTTRA